MSTLVEVAKAGRLRAAGLKLEDKILSIPLTPGYARRNRGRLRPTASSLRPGRSPEELARRRAAFMASPKAAQLRAEGRTIRKADADTRRKEQQFGLANNAFGAAAGVAGTKAVYNQAKEKYYPEKVAAQRIKRQAKVADRAAARYRAGKKPFTIAQRVKGRVADFGTKHRKVLAPAAIAGGVGMQLVNAGADAQSAAYFSRELATGHRKKKVAKDAGESMIVAKSVRPRTDGHGRRITEVSKRVRRFDSESDRKHRLGVYEGLGLTGAAAMGAAGTAGLRTKGLKRAAVVRRLKHYKTPLALIGGAGLSGTTAVAARRAYTRDRDQPWT